MIHATAIIHPQAILDPSVEVGPYAVIDAHVKLGAGCVVGPHVHLTGHTEAGERNVFHTGCVIGDAPQDLKYKNEPSRLRIGNDNVFREQAIIHRSNKLEDDTIIGSNNFLMAHSHIGHNVHVGNHTIIANGVLVAGHAEIGDRAFASGNSLVHQFVRVGTLSLLQGGTAISKDLPPFTIAYGRNAICGLNTVGLRRAGYTAEQRSELKQLYRFLFREGRNLRAAATEAQAKFTGSPSRVMLDFLANSKRGFCADVGRGGDEDGEE